jgi:sugar phosphate isomerase/epimerase
MNREILKNNNLISRRRFLGSVILATTTAAIISGCKNSSYQIGCYTRPWHKHDYRVSLDGIAEAGFEFTGFSTDYQGRVINLNTSPEQAAAMGKEATSRGLKIAVLSGGDFGVKESISKGIADLKHWIDNAASLGAPDLHFGGINDPDLQDAYYKVIAECCDYAEDKGVRLSVKPHGGPNTTGAQCRNHIEKVGHKNFGLWYDPGNVYYYTNGELDPVIDAEEIDGLVFGMSVKDFRMPREVAVTPGTGMVDFSELLSRLKKGGFTRGPLIVEGLEQGDLAYINDQARKARELLEEITK